MILVSFPFCALVETDRVTSMRMHTQFQSENLKVRDHKEALGADLKRALQWILRVLTGLSGSGQELEAGSCEHGNEPSGSIKGGEFLD